MSCKTLHQYNSKGSHRTNNNKSITEIKSDFIRKQQRYIFTGRLRKNSRYSIDNDRCIIGIWNVNFWIFVCFVNPWFSQMSGSSDSFRLLQKSKAIKKSKEIIKEEICCWSFWWNKIIFSSRIEKRVVFV